MREWERGIEAHSVIISVDPLKQNSFSKNLGEGAENNLALQTS